MAPTSRPREEEEAAAREGDSAGSSVAGPDEGNGSIMARSYIDTARIPTAPGTVVPNEWPDERFDVIWCFSASAEVGAAQHEFSQIPQLLLAWRLC